MITILPLTIAIFLPIYLFARKRLKQPVLGIIFLLLWILLWLINPLQHLSS